jgi:hypothetical protein
MDLDIPAESENEGLFQAVFSWLIIFTTCKRRCRAALSNCWSWSGKGRGSGRRASAKWARTWASILSVVASFPVAPANFRAARGLIKATGNWASARAEIARNS